VAVASCRLNNVSFCPCTSRVGIRILSTYDETLACLAKSRVSWVG